MYTLLDPGSTVSFVTPLIEIRFDVFPEIFHEPILKNTPIEDDIRAEGVYKNCPIHILDRVTYDDLVKLAMLDLDIILGTDCLRKCYFTIDYQKKVVRFQFPNELEQE